MSEHVARKIYDKLIHINKRYINEIQVLSDLTGWLNQLVVTMNESKSIYYNIIDNQLLLNNTFYNQFNDSITEIIHNITMLYSSDEYYMTNIDTSSRLYIVSNKLLQIIYEETDIYDVIKKYLISLLINNNNMINNVNIIYPNKTILIDTNLIKVIKHCNNINNTNCIVIKNYYLPTMMRRIRILTKN